QFVAGRELKSPDHDRSIRLGIGHVRPAKAPTGSGSHVHAHIEPASFGYGKPQHLHPLRAEIFDEFVLVTFRSVNRDDMNATHSGIAIAAEFADNIRGVDRASHPPPVGPRAGLPRDRRPRERGGVVSLWLVRGWRGANGSWNECTQQKCD